MSRKWSNRDALRFSKRALIKVCLSMHSTGDNMHMWLRLVLHAGEKKKRICYRLVLPGSGVRVHINRRLDFSPEVREVLLRLLSLACFLHLCYGVVQQHRPCVCVCVWWRPALMERAVRNDSSESDRASMRLLARGFHYARLQILAYSCYFWHFSGVLLLLLPRGARRTTGNGKRWTGERTQKNLISSVLSFVDNRAPCLYRTPSNTLVFRLIPLLVPVWPPVSA